MINRPVDIDTNKQNQTCLGKIIYIHCESILSEDFMKYSFWGIS